MTVRRVVAAFVILSAALAVPLSAQTTGRLEGTVTDPSGAPLEKVEVSIVSARTTSIRFDLATDKAGRFAQIGLAPGWYQVTFKKAGFAPKSTEIRISLAATFQAQIRLETADQAAAKTYSAADASFVKGNKLYGEQKYAEAAAAFEESIKANAANWGYYLNLGLARKKLGEADAAKAAFAKAAELNPESYSANKELGESLSKAGDFAGAKARYEKAVELSPDDSDARYNLGITLMNAGESDRALEQFQKAAALKPDYAEAYYYIGTISVGQNKVPEAVQALETFLKLAPEHPQAAIARQILAAVKKAPGAAA